MKQYTFDYDKLTIGDYLTMLDLFQAKPQNILPLIAIIQRCCTADVCLLPLSEVLSLTRQFALGLNVYYRNIRAR